VEKYNIKSEKEMDILAALSKAVDETPFSNIDVLQNFGVYTPRQTIARFLNRYEIYKKIIDVHGSILEFGVYKGGGTFSWFHFASIMEPYNINRRIYAFDTFEGFPEASDKDAGIYQKNDLSDASYDEMIKMADFQQKNIAVSHVPRLSFIKGDICVTLPKFLNDNPQLMAALVYIDVDIYKPTKTILQSMIKRVPKGGIIAFDEVNDPLGKGEGIALLEELDINNYMIKRNYFDSNPCYLVI
jgi:hypothetical protein